MIILDMLGMLLALTILGRMALGLLSRQYYRSFENPEIFGFALILTLLAIAFNLGVNPTAINGYLLIVLVSVVFLSLVNLYDNTELSRLFIDCMKQILLTFPLSVIFLFVVGSKGEEWLPVGIKVNGGSDFASYLASSSILSNTPKSELSSRAKNYFEDSTWGSTTWLTSDFFEFVNAEFVVSSGSSRFLFPYCARIISETLGLNIVDAFLLLLALSGAFTCSLLYQSIKGMRYGSLFVAIFLTLNSPTYLFSVLHGFYPFAFSLPFLSASLILLTRTFRDKQDARFHRLVSAFTMSSTILIYPELAAVFILITVFSMLTNIYGSWTNALWHIQTIFMIILVQVVLLNGKILSVLKREGELARNGFNQSFWYSPLDAIGVNPFFGTPQSLNTYSPSGIFQALSFILGSILFVYLFMRFSRLEIRRFIPVFLTYLVLIVYNLFQVLTTEASNNYSHNRITSIFFISFCTITVGSLSSFSKVDRPNRKFSHRFQKLRHNSSVSVNLNIRKTLTTGLISILMVSISFSWIGMYQKEMGTIPKSTSFPSANGTNKPAGVIARDYPSVASIFSENRFFWVNWNEKSLSHFLSNFSHSQTLYLLISSKNPNFNSCVAYAREVEFYADNYALIRVYLNPKVNYSELDLHRDIGNSFSERISKEDVNNLSCL